MSTIHKNQKLILDFKNIEYLRRGNARQKSAYAEIEKLEIFVKLKKYRPILTGTVPIEIDLPESDLDIICECKDHRGFSELISEYFGDKKDFKTYRAKINGIESTVAEFKTENFTFELFGQDIPTDKQNAYRHMIVEHRILQQKGAEFKNKVKKLKSKGIKTERAFAKLLKLKGNPFDEILKLES